MAALGHTHTHTHESSAFNFVSLSVLFCTYGTACLNTNLILQSIKQIFKLTKGIWSWKHLSLSKSLPCAKEKCFYLRWNFIFIIASEKSLFDVVGMFVSTDAANAADVGLQKKPRVISLVFLSLFKLLVLWDI